MTEEEKIIYNEGERLIPGVSHDEKESTRHYSSYIFFKKKITENIGVLAPTILDLGCGVGYGCTLLAEIPHSIVVGVDMSYESIMYAKDNYNRTNICYGIDDLEEFIPNMPSYGYVVSRGVFEHIANGISLIEKVQFNKMFLFDVPYDEKPVNKHHLLTGLTEEHFQHLPGIEFYYEDLAGNITKEKVGKPNMLMCVLRK